MYYFLFTVQRGFRGGCEGVPRGLGGVYLNKPPLNPQPILSESSFYSEVMQIK